MRRFILRRTDKMLDMQVSSKIKSVDELFTSNLSCK